MAEEFGKYLLLERINQGGMAEVYLAKAFGYGGTDQLIAVKRIRPEVSADPSFVEMFVNEAKLAVMLSHANIAHVFELGKTGDHYYIAMEYVAGRDLRALIARANLQGIQLPEHLVLYIVAGMLEGLDFAHRKTDPTGKPFDIVHRDVSPHNVLISYAGEVKLIDFGIAKFSTSALHLVGGRTPTRALSGAASHSPETNASQSGVLKGKYGYMAPEQVMGKTVDARTDVFATGIVLYELLTQRRLFEGTSDFSILEKVRNAEVYPPSFLEPRIPFELEQVVLRALAVDPEERYPTASDMHDAVVEVMLRTYGQPTPRELANLTRSLFAAEYKHDLGLLEHARSGAVTSLASKGGPPSQSLPRGEAAPVSVSEAEAQARLGDETVVEGGKRGARSDDTQPDFVVTERTVSDFAGGVTHEGFSPTEHTRLEPAKTVLGKSPRPTTQRMSAVERREVRRRSRSSESRPVVTSRTSSMVVRTTGRSRRRSHRDRLIIIGAFVVALTLVLGSWLATRTSRGGVGQVMIFSIPEGATVILDGVMVGETPYRGEAVPAGKRTMTLQREGYRSESRVIDVVADQKLPVQIVMRKLSD